jgi:hypothetical protein
MPRGSDMPAKVVNSISSGGQRDTDAMSTGRKANRLA